MTAEELIKELSVLQEPWDKALVIPGRDDPIATNKTGITRVFIKSKFLDHIIYAGESPILPKGYERAVIVRGL